MFTSSFVTAVGWKVTVSTVVLLAEVFGWRGGSGTMGGRSYWCFLGVSAFQSQTHTKRYYTTRVVTHWFAI